MADYVLYVGYDKRDATRSRFCPGSRTAIELVDQADMQERVTVQSVDALRESGTTLPAWLKGTPTLVCRESRKAMRGTAALDFLKDVQAQRREVGEGGGGAGGGEGGGAPGPGGHGLDGMVAAGEAAHLGLEANFEPLTQEDPVKYDDSRKVTDGDLQRLLERRKASIPPA